MSTWRDHRVWGLTRGELTWLAIGIVALAYELWAVATREGDVLTRAYRAHTTRWMIWPVGLGVLMGHLHGFAWAGAGTGIGGRWGVAFLVAAGLGILGRDFLDGSRYPVEWVFPLFVVGVAAGALLWVGRP